MSHSSGPANSPHSWYYPSTGPAPPTPVVVDTAPDYFGCQPSPLGMRATPTADDYAPCPSTPYCVPDEMQWSSTLESDQTTVFEDPLTVLASTYSGDRAQYDVAPHVSYCPTYDRERYASSPIRRATLDSKGLETHRVNAWPVDLPTRPSTCPIPVADHESFDHNHPRRSASLCREPDHQPSYRFPISTIQDLQHDLRTRWHSANPEPIPPVIVRLHDLVQPSSLRRRKDGCTFVVPGDGGIWDTIYQRGIDSSFWPICASNVVDAQCDVAATFAVNVFLESPDHTGSIQCCNYLGAYLLEVEGVLTISGIPHPFHHSLHLPYVRFRYHMWDESMMRLANESPLIVQSVHRRTGSRHRPKSSGS